MPAVIAESLWLAIGLTNPALGAEDKIISSSHFVGIPAHPDVLGPAKEIAAWVRLELLRREGKNPGRPRGLRLQRENSVVA